MQFNDRQYNLWKKYKYTRRRIEERNDVCAQVCVYLHSKETEGVKKQDC